MWEVWSGPEGWEGGGVRGWQRGAWLNPEAAEQWMGLGLCGLPG